MARTNRAPSESSSYARGFAAASQGQIDSFPALGLQRSLHERLYARPEPVIDPFPASVRLGVLAAATIGTWSAILWMTGLI